MVCNALLLPGAILNSALLLWVFFRIFLHVDSLLNAMARNGPLGEWHEV